ncbi:MAG: GGDEF domain-containing protein [Candidatus Planktophila sp.]|nr:GGDEF domain-containing protein [Candidatus Planktophila sp.]
MRINQIVKWLSPTLLIFNMLTKLFESKPTIGTDLILYNLVILLAIISLFQAPLQNDPLAVVFLSLAIASWGIGSVTSSISQFFDIAGPAQLVSNIAYSLFYPFAFIAIPRAIAKGKKLRIIELLDATIFGLGLCSIIAALVLAMLLQDSGIGTFFSVLYTICDIALVVIVLASAVISELTLRLILLIIGVLTFAITDFHFLLSEINGNYQFGQISDLGWAIGIVFMAISFWYLPSSNQRDAKIHPALIAVSIFISPALLSAIAIRPDYFPKYVVIPTITTLFLAFIRMTLVIRHANNLGEEKVLARTDELTGLPNRRRLIAELATFDGVEGALLLLDLDGFKPVNDRYGHEMGDRILRQVAGRFSRSLPSGAILARLGGDEFGILVSGSDDATLELASALKATLSYPFVLDGNTISISVSIGHVRNDGAGDLLQRADMAMYEAKRVNADAPVYLP